jgi:hypothetical protein
MVHRVNNLKCAEYTWNAAEMPSGIYALRVTTGNKTLVKRLILAR